MIVEDKYTEAQMKLRQDVLRIIFKKFGNGDYSNESIYNCADEWVEKYNVSLVLLIIIMLTNSLL